MRRIFNWRTFPVFSVGLLSAAAGSAWTQGEHAAAMFGLALAGFLALDIVRTEAKVRLHRVERLSMQTDIIMKDRLANSWQN